MNLRFLSLSFLMTAMTVATTTACMSELDQNTASIVFNNKKPFNISKLCDLGKDGSNYLRECFIDSIVPQPVFEEVQPMHPSLVRYPIFYDNTTISNVTFLKTILSLSVNYGGGCKEHEFAMFGDIALLKTAPPSVNIYLSHNANNDNCKSLITEKIHFNMTNESTIFGSESPVEILIFAMQDTAPSATALWYKDQGCKIQYRSHYSPQTTMVELSFMEDQTPQNAHFASYPRVSIVLDPNLQLDAPFNYKAAMMLELTWLSEQGVLPLSRTDIQTYGKKVTVGSQYWTLQDTAMAFNSTFTGERDSTGKWWIINTKRACGSIDEYALPPMEFVTTSVKTDLTRVIKSVRPVATQTSHNSIALNYSPKGTVTQLRLYNAKGERITVSSFTDTKGVTLTTDRALRAGWYAISITDAGGTSVMPLLAMHK